jgi:hypothetical protein
MKKLVLAFATLISTVSFSQVITITYNKTKAFNKIGNIVNTPSILSLLKTEPIFDVGDSYAIKVFDLNQKTLSFYEDGVLMTTLKIKSFTKNKNIYDIIISDINIYDGSYLDTYQYIDIDKNLSLYSWYYKTDNQTWLYKEYNNKIFIK